MTVALINRSIPLSGNGTIAKVPLKDRLRSLGSKYAQEKRAKSDRILESRSPCEYGTDSSPVTTYSREEPEVEAEIGGVTHLLAPTALRPSMSSPPFTTFDKKRHGMSLSRKFPSSTRKQTQQIRSPRQSKKALKKLSPSLSGSGAAAHSPWVNPSPVQSYPSTATGKEECGGMHDDIHSVSFQEHDLPHAIRPCYKFVPIEMAEMMEEKGANVINTYDSNDYDICSDEYLASHAEKTDLKKQKKKTKKDKTSKNKSLSQTKKNKQQQQQKKKPKSNTPVTPHIDKYAMHFQHMTTPKSSWWASLERGIRYSQCCY
jgi:hypothetical protein